MKYEINRKTCTNKYKYKYLETHTYTYKHGIKYIYIHYGTHTHIYPNIHIIYELWIQGTSTYKHQRPWTQSRLFDLLTFFRGVGVHRTLSPHSTSPTHSAFICPRFYFPSFAFISCFEFYGFLRWVGECLVLTACARFSNACNFTHTVTLKLTKIMLVAFSVKLA